MLIDIPSNYKRSNGKIANPIRYLCGAEKNLSPEDMAVFHQIDLFDHEETFVDRVTHERIFVSHPYGTTKAALTKLRAVLAKCNLMMTYYPDSWYDKDSCRIELRNAIVHDYVVNGGGVLRYGKRLVLHGEKL